MKPYSGPGDARDHDDGDDGARRAGSYRGCAALAGVPRSGFGRRSTPATHAPHAHAAAGTAPASTAVIAPSAAKNVAHPATIAYGQGERRPTPTYATTNAIRRPASPG